MPVFFVEKCEGLSQCKTFSLFSAENISVFDYKVVIDLTSCLLAGSLILQCFEQPGPGLLLF